MRVEAQRFWIPWEDSLQRRTSDTGDVAWEVPAGLPLHAKVTSALIGVATAAVVSVVGYRFLYGSAIPPQWAIPGGIAVGCLLTVFNLFIAYSGAQSQSVLGPICVLQHGGDSISFPRAGVVVPRDAILDVVRLTGRVTNGGHSFRIKQTVLEYETPEGPARLLLYASNLVLLSFRPDVCRQIAADLSRCPLQRISCWKSEYSAVFADGLFISS